MSTTALNERIATVNDLLCAVNLLVWDSRTMMPAGGTQARGHQIAALTRLARDHLASDDTLRALEGGERSGEDPEGVARVRTAFDLHRRVPASLVEERAALRAGANAAWVEARAHHDFALFKPWLAKTVTLARAYADALGWSGHPYDALLGLYEPGETVASLNALFATLRAGLAPVLDKARARTPATALRVNSSVADQLEASRAFAGLLGYDFHHGRLDATVHPFEISFTRGDVRITTRGKPDALVPTLFGAMHETGHALYEQNVDPAYTRTVFATDLVGLYAVGGASFGAHESQSRLFENHLGRSRGFWQRHLGLLGQRFPDLAATSVEAFHAAVTTVTPGPIRTEADELTYDLHIMARVELEAALIEGSLSVDDVPHAWAGAMARHLGVDVPDDGQGCLQDIHWSSGMLGSFCSYTIGNVMAAQLYEAATAAGVGDAVDRGDYAPLRGWLHEAVWRHGRRYGRDDLLRRATGRGLDPAPYVAYLAGRYG